MQEVVFHMLTRMISYEHCKWEKIEEDIRMDRDAVVENSEQYKPFILLCSISTPFSLDMNVLYVAMYFNSLLWGASSFHLKEANIQKVLK